jgi:AcrR family transcriptional regulator
MTRTVKDPDERRAELAATAQKLFYTKGYENTSVSDIVKAVGVAQGTFYYYFDSKQAILESVVEELLAQSLALVQPIIRDQNLDAITKWNQLMQVMGNWNIENKDDLLAMSRIMRMEENFRLRHKLRTEGTRLVASEFAPVIVQGIEEGVFDTDYPLETTEYAFTIMTMASDACLDILFDPKQVENPANQAWDKISAAQKTVERILGAPSGSLQLTNKETLTAWFEE